MIERSADGLTGWTTLGTAGTGTRAWLDGTVVPGETFHYRLTAPGVGTASAMVAVPPRDGLAGAVISGSALDLWRPGSIYAIAAQSDGKWIVGGVFTRAKSRACQNLARFNADGSVDPSFTANANNSVHCVAVQPDGKIIVGGRFTQIGSRVVPNLARLLADGTVDPAFQPNLGSSSASAIRALAILPDGRIVIGGGSFGAAYIQRLNPNGTRDTTFSAVITAPLSSSALGVQAMALQSDGKIVAGGDFVSIGGVNAQLARINTNGSLDTTFFPVSVRTAHPSSPPLASVRGIVVQPDGKIVMGGYFHYVGSEFISSLARFQTNGSRDTTFLARPSGSVDLLALLNGNRIGIGGIAGLTSGPVRSGWTTTDLNGNDLGGPSFLPGWIYAVATNSAGKVLIGGVFAQAANTDHQSLAALSPDGATLDPTFSGSVSAPGFANATAVQPDGRVIVAGTFTSIGGPESVGFRRHHVARIGDDNIPDNQIGVAPHFYGPALSTAVGSDGKIWVGGSLLTTTGSAKLVRLGTVGQLEGIAQPNVGVIEILPDANGGAALAGPFNYVDGSQRAGIAHVRADGSLSNADFAVGLVNGSVFGLARQSDNSRLVSGSYEMIMAQPRRYLTRALPGGTALDFSFNPAPNAGCSHIFANAHGIWVAGSFSNIGGAARPGLARLLNDGTADPSFVSTSGGNLLAVDGERCVLSGALSAFVPGRTLGVARLQPGGAYDPTFDIGTAPNGSPSNAVITGDTMLLGGSFSSFGMQPRQGLVRVRTNSALGPPAAPQSLAVTATTSTSAMLGWSTVAGVNGYLVEHRSTGTGVWQIAGVTDGQTAIFADAALPPGSAWQFRVSAFDAAGPSTPSASAAAVLPSTYAQWRNDWSIPADTGHGADPDTDGHALLAEYASALSPNGPDAEALAKVASAESRLTLTYLRARTDITYLVEASSDLAVWSEVGVDQGGPGPWVTASITSGIGPVFLRLRFTLIP